MNNNKSVITLKVEIEIGGKTHSISVRELKKLRDEIDSLFPRYNSLAPFIPLRD